MNITRVVFLFLILLMACKSPEPDSDPYVAVTGATIIDGSGNDPIVDGVLLIQKGKVVAIGTKEQVKIPENATIKDISGKTIVPGIINAHGHVGDVKGI